MADFRFLKNPVSGKWLVSAPRRAMRTNVGKKTEPVCPFCIGTEHDEPELYRVGGEAGDSNWRVRVIPNKYPFAQHHELIIHSPDHHKNFDELPFSQVELIIKTYRDRFNLHSKEGQIYIFHNRGIPAGESLPHPHTQLVVVPREVELEIPELGRSIIARNENTKQSSVISSMFSVFGYKSISHQSAGSSTDKPKSDKLNSDLPAGRHGNRQPKTDNRTDVLETEHFLIFCPETSEWPDEVWIAPRANGGGFGSTSDKQITDLAFVLSRLIQIYDLRHGHEFPFNFYIYPGRNWYLRLVPRMKTLGGFEIGTQVIVNTQDPAETFKFIKEHFWEPDVEKIRREHQADYWRGV